MTIPNAESRILVYESVSPVEEVRHRFEEHGITVTTLPGREGNRHSGDKISAAEFVAAALDVDAVMGMSSAQLSREVLASLPRLKYIAKLGIGYEVIDVEAATDLGILVTNTPVQEEIDAVAEHAIALILACLKRLDVYTRVRLQSTWAPDASVYAASLAGRTLGIVGYGRIGRAVARRLQGWNLRILTYDWSPGPAEWGSTAVDLQTLVGQADIVTVHASADRAGAPILDQAHLDQMKHGAVLVNTARGSLVDQRHLVQLLASGRLSAAGLDVFDPQPPPPDEPLLQLPNLIATPHSAAWNPVVGAAIQRMGIDNALALLSGRPPSTVVNPAALTNVRPSTPAAR